MKVPLKKVMIYYNSLQNNIIYKKKGIIWKFIPSKAPWMGAVWERLVGMVKIELLKMQKNKLFNEYEWRAHLTEIQSILNNRPLTYVSDIGTEPEVITPKALYSGCVSDSTLGIDKNIEEIYLEIKSYQNKTIEIYKEKMKTKQIFWNNLKNNYLTMLRNSKSKPDKREKQFCRKKPKIGDVVVIHEEDLRSGWKMGIIQELIPSSDGEVRAATVKTTIPNKKLPLYRTLNTTIRTKAICHLYPLELDIEIEDEIENNNEKDITINDTIEILEDSEWTLCSIENCLRPAGITLKWIQCGSCKDWFHINCMGLDNNKEMEETFFACLKCWKPKLLNILEEDEEIELDFSGFITEANEDLDYVKAKRCRKAAKKCREGLLKKIENKQL